MSAARDEIELFLEEGTMRPYIRTALRALLTELDDESRLRRQAEGRLLTLHPRAEVERLRASNDRLIEIAKTVETESEESTKAAWDEVERLRTESNDQFMRQQQVIGEVVARAEKAEAEVERLRADRDTLRQDRDLFSENLSRANERIRTLEEALRELVEAVAALEGVEIPYPLAISLATKSQLAQKALREGGRP